MKHLSIEQTVLKKITPTSSQRTQLQQVIQQLQQEAQNEIKKYTLPIQLTLVGSTAKDTYLINSLDIDLFLLFPQTTSREQLETIGLTIGRKLLAHPEESYAEHPYIRGIYQHFKTEIVPCYRIETSDQKLSSVDRTPLHTKYITAHLRENQKLDVRLLKQFLKGINCYGAEAEIEGFSGYLCELLILKYSSFQKVLQQAQHWKKGILLTLTTQPQQSFDTSLIFIDPVDPERNVASALSEEKFILFINACREYQKNPKETYFFPNPITPWSDKKIKHHIHAIPHTFIGITIQKPEILSENLYPQLRKACRVIQQLCEHYDFIIHDSQFTINESSNMILFIIRIENDHLPKTYTHMGPPEPKQKNVEQFLKKWKNDPRVIKDPYVENKRYYVQHIREYQDVYKLLEDKLSTLNLGKHLTKILEKEYKILTQNDLLSLEIPKFWTTYFSKKYSWEW